MKSPLWLLAALAGAALPVTAAVNVTQHHNNASRDGLFIDPAFTPTAAASIARDPNFDGAIVGNVYAQPLYVEGGPDNRAKVIVVTQSNNVYALDAITGAIIWQRNVGTPITSGLPCGNINPIGITSTPVIDLASRALFLDAEVSGSGHRVFSLNVDTGAINPGWPVTMNAAVSGFDSSVQSQRSALGLVNGVLYVPYGGRFGDCGSYRGRLVGIPLDAAQPIASYATGSARAGIWAVGGVASDGTNLYVATGNGSGAVWAGNEAVIRLQPGPVFSNNSADFWAPTNWLALDSADADLGGSAPVLFDVPGATPSALILQTGKDRNAYLINRTNMGGVVAPVAQAVISTGTVINAPAVYRTATSTYFAVRPTSGTLSAFRVNAGSPPTITNAWSVSSAGRTSPFVTMTSANTNPIVWAFGTGTSARLFGYNGDTGAVVFNGGGATDTFSGTRNFNTGIAARGRIYLAGDNKVTAFKVPFNPPAPTSAVSRKTHGSAGNFDVNLPLAGTPGIECRSGGPTNDFTIVATFANNVSVTGDLQAEATTGAAQIGTGGTSNGGAVTVKGNTVTIPLTNVTNAQTINVRLNGVTDGVGYGDIVIPMSRLLGDVTNNRDVNASDIGATKAGAGQLVTTENFRADVAANGQINATDVSIVKSTTGTNLP